ncbi:MAG: hypothetical protein KDD59_06125 [Bdellovibrionales bacterium]|nr:hypothetical protein [Bdellovibrionales bacterium]
MALIVTQLFFSIFLNDSADVAEKTIGSTAKGATTMWKMDKCKKWLISLMVCLGLGLVLPAQAEDLDDVEAGVDAALAESDAAIAGKESAERMRQEEQERLDEAREDAQQAISKARSKERDAKEETDRLMREIEKLKAEQKKEGQKKQEAERQYVTYEKKVKTVNDQLLKVKTELEVARQERERQDAKTATIISKVRVLEEELQKVQGERDDAVAALEEAKRHQQDSAARLIKTTKESEQESVKLNKKIGEYKGRLDKAKKAALDNEAKMRAMRTKMDRLSEDVAMAESEAEQAEQRAEDSGVRVETLRKQTEAKQQDLNQRRKEALDSRKNYETQETANRSESSKLNDDKVRQAAMASGEGRITTMKKQSRSRLKLKRTCNVRSTPSSKGKVLFSAKQGKQLSVSSHSSSWYVVPMKNGKGFISKKCF